MLAPVNSSNQRRIARELKTVRVMIDMYCRDHHGGGRALCESCASLWSYAEQRVERCPLRADKPTCLNCPVHCYKVERRQQIRVVMRYAGPRMAWRHPILSLMHFIDGRHVSSSVRGRAASRQRTA
jgi:hypothetical protein